MAQQKYTVEFEANVSKALGEIEKLRGKIEGIEKGGGKIKIDIDTKSLDEATKNINDLMNALKSSKGDFSQFKELGN